MEALNEIGWKKALRFILYGGLQWMLHISYVPIARTILLRGFGAKVGSDTIIFDVFFSNLYHYGFRNLSIGKRCFLGDQVFLDCRGKIMLGNNVTISNRVNVVTHINVGFQDHPLQQAYPVKEDTVRLEDGVYIGTGATILPGVTVGRESVVGAGAVVTHDVPPHCLVVGVPAKVKKKLGKMNNKDIEK